MTNVEPGESEFSWGKGLQAPEELGAVPSLRERHRALLRNDAADRNLDPGAEPNYDEYVREP
jgi:hypothetical protein